MNRRARIVLAVILAVPCAVVAASAAGAGSIVGPDSLQGSSVLRRPQISNFKLKAGGQIDLATSTVSFAGHASKLGQFTATGIYDGFASTMEGTMIPSNGPTLRFVLQFVPPPAGDSFAQMSFGSGPGPLFLDGGEAFGSLFVDDDMMFTLDLNGFIENF